MGDLDDAPGDGGSWPLGQGFAPLAPLYRRELRDAPDIETADVDGAIVPVVSVILPTYNEAENIVEIVGRVLLETWAADITAEVIVVDDDSPDETWRLVENEYDDLGTRVRVIRREGERGLGSAVERGFQDARAPVCLVMDADFQHPPERVPDLVAPFLDGDGDGDDVDLVVGSRRIDDGGIEDWSFARHAVSWGATVLARAGSNRAWALSDPMSGFFAVRRALVDNVVLRPDGYKILLEVVDRAQPARLVEVGYVFQPRRAGESNFDVSESVRFVRHATRLGARLASVDVALAAGFVVAVGVLLAPRRDPLAGLLVGGALLVGAAVLAGFLWLVVQEATAVEVER